MIQNILYYTVVLTRNTLSLALSGLYEALNEKQNLSSCFRLHSFCCSN